MKYTVESSYNELGYNEIPLLTNEPSFPGVQPSLRHYLFAAYNEHSELAHRTNPAFNERISVSREAFSFKDLPAYNELSNFTDYNKPRKAGNRSQWPSSEHSQSDLASKQQSG